MWVELTWWWRKIGHSNSILIDILNRSSNIIQFESRSSRLVVNTCAVILFTDHESRDSRLSMSVWFDTSHKLISVGSRVINMAQCNSKRVLLFRTSNASESWYSWWSVVTELSRYDYNQFIPASCKFNCVRNLFYCQSSRYIMLIIGYAEN